MAGTCRRPFRSCHHVPNTLFYHHCVVLAKFLRCWVLSLADFGMKMHIKIIGKRLLRFHLRLTRILVLKSHRFSISFSLSVKNSFQSVGPLADILYFELLNWNVGLYNLVPKISRAWICWLLKVEVLLV